MSFYNATKNPFPFYPLEGEVWTNKKPLWFGNSCNFNYQKYPIFPGKRFFQLRVSDSFQAQSDITAVNLRSATSNSIAEASIARTLYVLQKPKRNYMVIEVEIPSGYVGDRFYVSVETNFGYYYSEPFCISTPNDSIGIVWSNSKGRVGDLIYPSGYRHMINIEAEIIPLEPQVEEETIENGFGEERPTLQILKQGFTFSFMAPNYLAQALSALRLHDQLQIINRQRYDYDEDFDEDIKDVQVKVVNEEDGCFSFVTISYVEETIISTTCEDEIVAANNPPQADIVWEDTQTAEERFCNTREDCQRSLLVTEFTFDPDNNLDTLEWERSSNLGVDWSNLGIAEGVGSTLEVNGSVDALYWYRLKATDTFGAVGYSNIIKYNIFESASFASVYVTDELSCEDGNSKIFDIIGDIGQSVKMKTKVLNSYGHGYTVNIYNRLTGAKLITWASESAGTERIDFLGLDGAGYGRFRVEICHNPCILTPFRNAAIVFTLFRDNNYELGNSNFTLSAFSSC